MKKEKKGDGARRLREKDKEGHEEDTTVVRCKRVTVLAKTDMEKVDMSGFCEWPSFFFFCEFALNSRGKCPLVGVRTVFRKVW